MERKRRWWRRVTTHFRTARASALGSHSGPSGSTVPAEDSKKVDSGGVVVESG